MSTAPRPLQGLTRQDKILYLCLAATVTGGYVWHVGSDPWSYHNLYDCMWKRLCPRDRHKRLAYNRLVHGRNDLVDRRHLPSWVGTLSVYLSGKALRFKRWWIKYWYGKTEWELFIEMVEQNRRQVLQESEPGHSDIENYDPRDRDYYKFGYGLEDTDVD